MSTIYLYVKQHSITGLLYFGCTELVNPFKYLGSGDYWKKHLKKHGKEHVKTIEVWGFDDQELCTAFALKFSEDNNIVEAIHTEGPRKGKKVWANKIPENAMRGWVKGSKHSDDHKTKISHSVKKHHQKRKEKELPHHLSNKSPWNKGLTKEVHPSLQLLSELNKGPNGRTLSNEHKEAIGSKWKGKKRGKQSEEHTKKVQETKRKNGTLSRPWGPGKAEKARGKISMTDSSTGKFIRVNKDEVDSYINKGYVLGWIGHSSKK